MPGMVYSPALKAQEKGAMRTPVKGTIPRNYTAYPYRGMVPDAPEVKRMKNPYSMTREHLRRGQERYQIYCGLCHGAEGGGGGLVAAKFPGVPPLNTARVKGMSDGELYHKIVDSQSLMPSYERQIHNVEDRWAIVNFMRVLYRAKNPSRSDLKKADDW